MSLSCTVSEIFNVEYGVPWNLGYGSFKVIGNGTIVYSIDRIRVPAFNSSYGTVFCQDKARYWSKIMIFKTPPTFNDPGNPLECRGNYIATSNNIKLVHWPLMGGLLHLVQRGGDWAGWGPAHSPPRCTKYNSPPINGQCTNFTLFDVAL